MNEFYSEAFAAIANLGLTLGVHPIHKHEKCWEHQIDEHWWIAVNGHTEDKACSHGNTTVPPFHCLVEFNGWPAGLFSPYGGMIAAGSAANEDSFIAAIEAATAKAKGEAP